MGPTKSSTQRLPRPSLAGANSADSIFSRGPRPSLVPSAPRNASTQPISRGVTKPVRSTLAQRALNTRTSPEKPQVPAQDFANDTKTVQAKMEGMEGMMSSLLSQMSLLQSQLVNPPAPVVVEKAAEPIQIPVFQMPQITQIAQPTPVIIQKKVKAPKKPKTGPPKRQVPVFDTSAYTNQIKQSHQQLEEIMRLQSDSSVRFQIEAEMKSNQISAVNSQLSSVNTQSEAEREKGANLRMELENQTQESNRLQTKLQETTQELVDELDRTKQSLTDEFNKITTAGTTELNSVNEELSEAERLFAEQQQMIADLEEQIANQKQRAKLLEQQMRTSETLRKKLHNEIQELKGNLLANLNF